MVATQSGAKSLDHLAILDMKFHNLFMANDLSAKNTLVDNPVVTLEVDLDAGTYAVGFNGKTYPNIPLENEGPIDTIRFVTTGCSKTGFLRAQSTI